MHPSYYVSIGAVIVINQSGTTVCLVFVRDNSQQMC